MVNGNIVVLSELNWIESKWKWKWTNSLIFPRWRLSCSFPCHGCFHASLYWMKDTKRTHIISFLFHLLLLLLLYHYIVIVSYMVIIVRLWTLNISKNFIGSVCILKLNWYTSRRWFKYNTLDRIDYTTLKTQQRKKTPLFKKWYENREKNWWYYHQKNIGEEIDLSDCLS